MSRDRVAMGSVVKRHMDVWKFVYMVSLERIHKHSSNHLGVLMRGGTAMDAIQVRVAWGWRYGIERCSDGAVAAGEILVK